VGNKQDGEGFYIATNGKRKLARWRAGKRLEWLD
jgi:hypothetical protein